MFWWSRNERQSNKNDYLSVATIFFHLEKKDKWAFILSPTQADVRPKQYSQHNGVVSHSH
jgi:hypothetical protein